MKQPELGNKIAALRKAKGMTQEELVERCNINVRTIQRIEAGEVMPRSYTIKMILGALDAEYSMLIEEAAQSSSKTYQQPTPPPRKMTANQLKEFLLLEIDLQKPQAFLLKQLSLAWTFGIIYFVCCFPEAIVEFGRVANKDMMISTPFYITLKILLLIAFVFFQRGLIILGGLYQNYLLQVIALIGMAAYVVLIAYDIITVFYPAMAEDSVFFSVSLFYGMIGIVYAVAFRRLGQFFGTVAKVTALFELIAAAFFLSMILFFVGDLVHAVAELLAVVILYKAHEKIRAGIGASSLNG